MSIKKKFLPILFLICLAKSQTIAQKVIFSDSASGNNLYRFTENLYNNEFYYKMHKCGLSVVFVKFQVDKNGTLTNILTHAGSADFMQPFVDTLFKRMQGKLKAVGENELICLLPIVYDFMAECPPPDIKKSLTPLPSFVSDLYNMLHFSDDKGSKGKVGGTAEPLSCIVLQSVLIQDPFH